MPEKPAEEVERPPIPTITAGDLENQRIRDEIAARQAEAYHLVLAWPHKAFGDGWLPSCRHELVDKTEEEACRRTEARHRAAFTVYTVRKGDERRHFTVGEDGAIVEHASSEEGFGEHLLEPHPTQRIEVRGQLVAPHHYSLLWAGYELYEPRSAEDLAVLRASRDRLKKERELEKWKRDHPLLAHMGLGPDD
jgi:hypothetical protein